MPKGPNGQKRPADVIGAAVMVGRIATGEVEDTYSDSAKAERGSLGGTARASALDPQKRREIAQRAAARRWEKKSQ